MKKKYNIAVVGATGNAGHKVLEILVERQFPVANIIAIASENSAGKLVSFGDAQLEVQRIDWVDFSNIDICFMCAGSGVSRSYARKIAAQNCVVIDKTSLFRLSKNVPLVVPEINAEALLSTEIGIVSNPNCVAIPLAIALKPLLEISPIKRVVVSTYQSVSGAGKRGISTLYEETRASFFGNTSNQKSIFQKSITGNIIPMIGDLLENGSTDEEDKISKEVPKILNISAKFAVTSVRVPVYIGHSISVACEFENEVSVKQTLSSWNKFKAITILNSEDKFVTPAEAQGEDNVFISRIRKDSTVDHGLLFWVVCDNLRKGAALNGVQIAEHLIKKDPTLKLFWPKPTTTIHA